MVTRLHPIDGMSGPEPASFDEEIMRFEEFVKTIISDFQRGLIQAQFAQSKYIQLFSRIVSMGREGMRPFISNIDIVTLWNLTIPSYQLEPTRNFHEQLLKSRIAHLTDHELATLEAILETAIKLPLKFTVESAQMVEVYFIDQAAGDYLEATRTFITNGIPFVDVADAQVTLQCNEKFCTQLTILQEEKDLRSIISIDFSRQGAKKPPSPERSEEIMLPLTVKLDLVAKRSSLQLPQQDDNDAQ